MYLYSALIQLYLHIITPSNVNNKLIWRSIMNIKILSVLTILSVFSASHVMANDFKRNHNYNDKRQHSHVVVKNKNTTKRVVTTHYYGKGNSKKVVTKKVISKKPVQYKNSHKRNGHNRNDHVRNGHDRHDRLGLIVGGIVVGSILAGR